jgi:DNA-binding transcriptional ArsR family regulator
MQSGADGGTHAAAAGDTSPLRLDRVLHALSDPVRLGIVVQLHRHGEASCATLDGGRPKSSMSHHFRVLREAGLVHTRPQGVTLMNSLRRDSLEAAFPGLLDAVVRSATAENAGSE